VFFFQAEDGIRDRNVTGVQTCALPICSGEAALKVTWPNLRLGRGTFPYKCKCVSGTAKTSAGSGRSPIRLIMAQWPAAAVEPRRSEERRVGKEWSGGGGAGGLR